MHAKIWLHKAFTVSEYVLSKKLFDSLSAYFHDFPLPCEILALHTKFYSLIDTHYFAAQHTLWYFADFKN